MSSTRPAGTKQHESATRQNLSHKPALAIISGPDIASRLPFAKQLATDFDVTLIGSYDFGRTSIDGFEYRKYRLDRTLNPALDLFTLVQLRSLLAALKPQIVQTFSTKPSILARLAAAHARVPVIVGTVPGMGSIYGDNRMSTRALRRVYERVQALACRVSTLTVFQNDEDLAEFVLRGLVRREETRVVPGSGVDTNEFRPDSFSADVLSGLKSSLGVPRTAVVVTMVTRIIRSKGVIDFAEAARLLAQDDPKPHFLLVGEVDRESREALTGSEWANVQRHVHCLGKRPDIAAILAITDVFALPSYYREGIPRALLEAAASGKALISTDLPGCRDVVRHGSTGLIIPPRDPRKLSEAIAELVGDRNLRVRLGSAARNLAVERFDLALIAKVMRDVYFELIHAGH